MNGRVVIALDAMGGDHGPAIVVPAALSALETSGDLDLILVGDERILNETLAAKKADTGARLRVVHASQSVAMDEPPSQALRNKRDSSMRIALNLVKQGEAQACVSAGNTGALMAIAKFVLKTLPGIDRPAIMASLPSITGHTNMLDLGANVDCRAENLFQFAIMGSVLTTVIDDIKEPRVGLLNVGQEAIKGNEQVKEADRLLKASGLNYIGYVEGDSIYRGGTDVVVCDGFVGNVSLKTTEGVATMIQHFARQEFGRSLWTRIAGGLALPVLKSFRRRIDPRRYNGASLLGLQGVVIKSHGGADRLAFEHAIHIAEAEARKEAPRRIETQLASLLERRHAS